MSINSLPGPCENQVNKDQQYKAATKIQAWVRGFQCRGNLIQQSQPALEPVLEAEVFEPAPEQEGLSLTACFLKSIPPEWEANYGIANKKEGVISLQQRPESSGSERMKKGYLWLTSNDSTEFSITFNLLKGSGVKLNFNDSSTGKAYYVEINFGDSENIFFTQGEIVDGITENPFGKDCAAKYDNKNVTLKLDAGVSNSNIYARIGAINFDLPKSESMSKLDNVIVSLAHVKKPNPISTVTNAIAISEMELRGGTGKVEAWAYSQVGNENPVGGDRVLIRDGN